ncbi:unnamed protein product [Prorocentrum cordatum]|nr:unnamed protein product [Polarella glacialis]
MKENQLMDHSSRPCLRQETDVHSAWAKYFVKWIAAYQQHGVPIWAVTVQNEPENNATWEACLFTPGEEADFLGKYLGPALSSEHSNVSIFVYDHNKDNVAHWAKIIREHKDAAKYADGIAFHWYSGDGFEDVASIHAAMPQLQLLASEATYERWRWKEGATLETGEWSFGEGYAHDIIGDLNAGSIGWIDWNLLLDEKGGPNHVDNVCDAAMMANLSKGDVYRHPQYYFMGHFSKFILPDSVRLVTTVGPTLSYRGNDREYGSCTGDDGLQATSFLRPDGLVSTVVLNCGDDAVEFKLLHGERAALTSVPPHSIQTYVFEDDRLASPFRAGNATPFVGVNLGGWLLAEDWMWASEMFSQGIEDEYTLVQKHGGPEDPRAVSLMQAHWETFLTEGDLDRLQEWGVSHVRVPLGWWTVDYDVGDGFVDGSKRYLRRLIAWLQRRGMRALLDLHALPGAQTAYQSFTGRKRERPHFFTDPGEYERGKRAMLRLAELILELEAGPATAGVVLGMELVNEPDWTYWDASPGIRELYEEMVPKLRSLLPAGRYALFLNFMESPRFDGAAWLASKLKEEPEVWQAVVYDAHVYHAYGDDDREGNNWTNDMDSCKTCCRDRWVLWPVVQRGLPLAIGEFSLNTGFGADASFYPSFMGNQLSLWASGLPGLVGSFFWNFKILPDPRGYYRELSLVDLIAPRGPLPPVQQTDLSAVCPRTDLSLCPDYDRATVRWQDDCFWKSGGRVQGRAADVTQPWQSR